MSEETTDAAEEPEPRRRKGVWHVVRWVLAALACVLAVVAVTGSVAAYYARLELLDTDRFTERTAVIAEDEQVQAGISALIAREIEQALDVEQISAEANAWIGAETAPALVESLVASAVETLKGYIQNEVDAFVASPEFLEVWDTAVREAHSSLVSALEGENAGAIQAEGNTLTLDLGKVVAVVKERMVEADVALAEDIPAVEADYVLLDSEQVPELQRTVDRLEWAATWLPWIAVGLLLVGLILMPRRWVAVLVVGALAAVLAGAALWAVAEGRPIFIENAGDAAFAPITYDAFTSGLRSTYTLMLWVGAALAVVALVVLFLRRRRAEAQ
ncbi:hypothetical protein [Glycomyces algeriensis]|uniref:Integral membrane protein n=1 Tax=Glycomyces algeriensis TaxID=256037 RepID=A0A9W6GD46_9ACTN|nr:hypothetical protein [Glycomyces algeriensis]MDA1368262.1 hypothetical protein [Glycomyces algeriensis]MDR7351902.1 hypothetical protein [Glycomyces algeriensis]GLI44632.1 hypothetical protein GALLR39Z86_44820 [Glycomyces algeriensis]